MSYIGKQRGRKKVLSTIRLVHDGAGNTEMFKDGVSQGTAALTTSTWFELFSAAQMTATVNYLEIFDSTGETNVVGVGPAASEVQLFQIVPGGNEAITVRIDDGQRVAMKAISANPGANTETTFNFYD